MSPEQLDMNISIEDLEEIEHLNVTDEEKEQRLALESPLTSQTQKDITESLLNRPFLETILNSYFALCLLTYETQKFPVKQNQGCSLVFTFSSVSNSLSWSSCTYTSSSNATVGFNTATFYSGEYI